MGENISDLTAQNFDKEISKGNWVVDFWAEWCGPCKVLGPIVEEASKEIKNVKFAKLDVDAESDISQRFEVMSIPTLIFFKDGEMVNRVSGVIEKEEIQEMVDSSF